MGRHQLDGVRLKLDRAQQQLNSLNRAVRRHVLDPDAYKLAGDFEPQTSEQFVVRVRAKRPIPPRWPVLIGEIAHDLRSALDHLAWQLAGPNPPPHTEFPIFLNSKKYNRKDRGRGPARGSGLYKVRGMSAPARTAIRDLQPYRRAKRHGWTPGSDPLWLLHELNRVDKHQLLQLTAITFRAYGYHLVIDGQRTGRRVGLGRGPLKDGAVIACQRIDRRGNPEVEVESYIAPDIAFANPGPYKGRAVIGVLLDAGDTIVGDVLTELEPLLPS